MLRPLGTYRLGSRPLGWSPAAPTPPPAAALRVGWQAKIRRAGPDPGMARIARVAFTTATTTGA